MRMHLDWPRFVLAMLATGSLASAQPLVRSNAVSLTLPPELPPLQYSTTQAYPNLSFFQPVALVSPPGETKRLFVVEKTGRIWVIPDVTAAISTRQLFLDLTGRVTVSQSANDERGLLALAFHPQYSDNGYFYIWYTTQATTAAGSGLHDRLARFSVSASDPNTANPDSELPLISQFDQASNHNGGELLFGPDGCLYLSLGDEGGGNDQYQNSQLINRDFFAGIIRIDVDKRPGTLPPNPHPAVHAGAYTVPADNPFVGATSFNAAPVDPAGVRTEFWAVGLRNPWRMSFDPVTGRLWCADVGQSAREEIDVIVRGGNYGWNYREGTITGPKNNPPAGVSFESPIWDYARSEGTSVTGGFVYRGMKLPSLYGRYLFADYASGRVWALQPDGTKPGTSNRVTLLTTDAGISSFGLDPATGDILFADLLEGVIKKISAAPVSGSTPLPATLTATGAFASPATLTPAVGVVAYEPIVPAWTDHALAQHWFALKDAAATFGFSATGNWSLPPGAVWIQHLDLERTRGDRATARRVETRFLVRTASGAYGISYRWNDAQTEATLVPEEGATQEFTVTENGLTRAQTWRFPSRSECMRCHTQAGGYALGFNARQLNQAHAFAGGDANILTALAQAGYFSSATAPTVDLQEVPAHTPVRDPSRPLDLRARSYLDANCSQCHQPGGPALGSFDCRAATPLAGAGLINGPLVDQGGDPANRVIVPGDVAHSRLLQRMSAAGSARMPPIGSSERDLPGEQLLADWIVALAAPPTGSTRVINLSSRGEVTSGGAILITGFTITGNADKRVLVRAVGPGLADFGVGGWLAQPALALWKDGAMVAGNVRWGTSSNVAELRTTASTVGAFPLVEGGNDSALVVSLPPGGYTAHATSADGSPGIALVEVYDADTPNGGASPSSRLTNASIRARVGSGDAILIPGISLGAGSARTLLIRAVGPGLAPFAVPDFLPQPALSLHRGQGIIASNTRWHTAPNADAVRTATAHSGAFALAEGSADSALLVTLEPGGYTVHVSSADNTPGIVLVEIYEVL